MSGISDLKRYFRRPARREVLGLALLIFLVAIVKPIEPYDWLQRSITAQLNSKPYEGDAAIVAIDARTERELPSRAWSKSDLADLLTRLSAQKPKTIIVAQQYFETGVGDGDETLLAALKQLESKPGWQIDIAPQEVRPLDGAADTNPGSDVPPATQMVEPYIADLVQPSIAVFRRANDYAPILTQYVVNTSDGVVPSSASVLAQGAAAPLQNLFTIDLSYNTRTIPEFSCLAFPIFSLLSRSFFKQLTLSTPP